METRLLKNLKNETLPEPAFVEVIVKEELEDESDDWETRKPKEASPRKQSKTTSTNTKKIPEAPKPPAVYKRSRYTQVIPEDLDLAIIKESDRLEMLQKGSPIDSVKMVPQCRICLRRVARENLSIILPHHKKKARVAFQIRVFPHDSYPFICINCQNLLDMFFEFKIAMIKAKSLLVSNRAFIESNGWDDQEYINLFEKCKQAIVVHRQQIDAYEEQIKPQKVEYEEEHLDEEESVVENIVDLHDAGSVQQLIKPECVINDDEIPTLSIDGTISVKEIAHPVIGTDEDNTKRELSSPEGDNSMDEDYVVDDDDDEDYIIELPPPKKRSPAKKEKVKKERTVKAKKERKVRVKKEKKDKTTPVVTRQLCDLCGEYIRPESVESHANKHLGIKPYVCSIENCDVTFSSKYNLSKHIRKFHKPGGVGSHTCNICGKVIQGSIGVLKYHQKRHNVTQKSHVCPVCGKGFTMKWYLTQHSIIHTGEFPHKCKYCGKRFNNKWSMKTHEKNIHEKKNQMPVQSQIDDSQPQTEEENPPGIEEQQQQIAEQQQRLQTAVLQTWNPVNCPGTNSQNVYTLITEENSGQ
ncbi:zinc finger E-box-binding homeobox 1-like [Armigeres subalbatus]|uniref:zinc finger E-box-binding homeobox 1-like n=1 Tax=Armigeres subalbatus TaxID=124917 RepID=UPI002ED00E69